MAFPTGWGYKQKITIDNTKVSATQSDFPVLIDRNHLHDDVVDPSGSNSAQSDGGDVRFSSDAAGTTQLACEVVEFAHDTTTGAGDAQIQIWVKVPSVSGSVDTDIYIWYDTAGTDTQPAVTDTYGRNNVWDSSYVAVLHLDEAVNTTTNGYVDSTGNGNHGTGVSMSLAATAVKIGDGQDFDGTADYITLGDIDAVDGVSALTVEQWFNFDALSNLKVLTNKYDPGGGGTGWVMELGATGAGGNDDMLVATSGGDYGYTSTNLIATGNTYFGVMVFDGGQSGDANRLKYYHDGSQRTLTFFGTQPATLSSTSNEVRIAAANDGTRNADAQLDEIRLSTAARPATWITTEYNNQNSPSTFASSNTPVATSGNITSNQAEVGDTTGAALEVIAQISASQNEAGDVQSTSISTQILNVTANQIEIGDTQSADISPIVQIAANQAESGDVNTALIAVLVKITANQVEAGDTQVALILQGELLQDIENVSLVSATPAISFVSLTPSSAILSATPKTEIN